MLSIIRPNKLHKFVLVLALLSLITFATGYGGTDYIKGEETETYEIVQEEWKYSQEINFSEVWEGERHWGSSHRIYPIQINTKKLIEEGKIREDCMDIRIASEGKLVGTRVQDRTCNTEETWVYFSNARNAFGYFFEPVEKVEQIEVFYGNKEASLGNHRVSPYNRNLATYIRPESAIEMYYGTHGGVWVNHNTHLHENDKGAPSQTWHVSFRNDHGGVGTDYIVIQDQDGNSVSRNSGDYYTIDSSNVPSWVQQGEDITVYFRSNYQSHSGERATSSQKSAQWGIPVQFSNPSPAKSTSTSPTSTSSPELSVDIDEPSGGGNNYDVTFYDASDDSIIGSDTVSGGQTASQIWDVAPGQTYTWYVKASSSYGTKKSSEWTFDTNGNPTVSNPQPSDGEVIKDNSPEISAEYNDPEGDSGTITYYDSSDNLIGSCSVSNGNRCGVEWSSTSYGVNEWYAVASDNNGGSSTGPIWSFTINRPPNQVSSPDPDGKIVYGKSGTLSVDVSDPDGNNMDVEFLNNQSNLSTSERTVSNVASGETASVDMTNLERRKTYKWWVKVSDNWHSTKSGSWTFYANGLPRVYDEEPSDGGVRTPDTGETLTVSIVSSDDKSSDVTTYYFQGNGDFLGKITDTSGSRTEMEYPGTQIGETYDWYVKAGDGNVNYTSNIFSFRRVTSANYRVEPEIEYRYSAVIMDETGIKDVFFKVENKIEADKDLKTYISGVNATFAENNQDSIDYTLEGDSERKFIVTIDPESDGSKSLKVISENQEYGVNTSTSIPVFVKNYTEVSETSEVPGIGPVQIFLLIIVSSTIYLARL